MDLSDPGVKYGSLKNFDVEEKKIGQGQFSVVHRAVCKIDGRCVALKKVQVRYSDAGEDVVLEMKPLACST